jgi:hypothetical protein
MGQELSREIPRTSGRRHLDTMRKIISKVVMTLAGQASLRPPIAPCREGHQPGVGQRLKRPRQYWRRNVISVRDRSWIFFESTKKANVLRGQGQGHLHGGSVKKYSTHPLGCR